MSTDHTNVTPPFDPRSLDGAGDFQNQSIVTIESAGDAVTGGTAQTDVSASVASGQLSGSTRSTVTATPSDAIEFRVFRAGSPVRRLRLGGHRYTFGSGEGCSIRLNDPALRPMHAVLVRDESRILVRAYSVPIEVNQKRVGETTLNVGDVLTIGSYRFELLSTSATTVLQDGIAQSSAADAASFTSSPIESSSDFGHVASPDVTEASRSAVDPGVQPSPLPLGVAAVDGTSPKKSFDEWNTRLREEVQQWRARRAEADKRDARSDERENQLQGRETELWSRADSLHKRENELKKQESAAVQIHQEFERKQLELLRLRQESVDRQGQFEERETEFKQVETAYQEQVELATRQLQQSQEQADAATAAVSRMREQFVSLNQQLEELTDQQQEIERHDVARLADFDRQKSDLTLARNQAIEQRNQAHHERDNAIDGIARSEAKRQIAEKNLAQAADDLASERAKYEKERRQVADSGSESLRLQQQIEQLQSAVEAAQLESARLRAQYSEASQSIARLEALNRRIEASGQNERTAWSIETGELRDTIQRLSTDLAAANSELTELRSSNASLIGEIALERTERLAATEAVAGTKGEDWSVLKSALARATEKLAALKSVYDETLDQIDQAAPQPPRDKIQFVNGLAVFDAGNTENDVPTAQQLAARFDASVEELAVLIDGLMKPASSASPGVFNAHETWVRKLAETANNPDRVQQVRNSPVPQTSSDSDKWISAVSDLNTDFGADSLSVLVSFADATAFSGSGLTNADSIQQTADPQIISPLLSQDVSEISVHQTDGLTSTVTPTAEQVCTQAATDEQDHTSPTIPAASSAEHATTAVAQHAVDWADVVASTESESTTPPADAQVESIAEIADEPATDDQSHSLEARWGSASEPVPAELDSTTGTSEDLSWASPEPEPGSDAGDFPDHGAFEGVTSAGSLASLLIKDLDVENEEVTSHTEFDSNVDEADEIGLTPEQLAVLSASEALLSSAAEASQSDTYQTESTDSVAAEAFQSDSEYGTSEIQPQYGDAADSGSYQQEPARASDESAEYNTPDENQYADEMPTAEHYSDDAQYSDDVQYSDDAQYADDSQFSAGGYGVSEAVEYKDTGATYTDPADAGSEQTAYDELGYAQSGYQAETQGYSDDQPQSEFKNADGHEAGNLSIAAEPSAAVTDNSQVEIVDESDAGGEDSIEAYMNRLLNRVQGGPAGSEPAPESQPVIEAAADPEPYVDADDAMYPSDEQQELLDSGEQLAPRSQAPEGQSMAAMRELANQSARNAINRSSAIQSRDTQLRAVMKLVQGIVAALCGAVAFIFVAGALKLVAVIAALVIAAICVNEARVLMQERRTHRPNSAEKVSEPEIDAAPEDSANASA